MSNKKNQKKILKGKPWTGHVSSQKTAVLQLCVKNGGTGSTEAKAELMRRGKPLLPPAMISSGENPEVDQPEKITTVKTEVVSAEDGLNHTEVGDDFPEDGDIDPEQHRLMAISLMRENAQTLNKILRECPSEPVRNYLLHEICALMQSASNISNYLVEIAGDYLLYPSGIYEKLERLLDKNQEVYGDLRNKVEEGRVRFEYLSRMVVSLASAAPAYKFLSSLPKPGEKSDQGRSVKKAARKSINDLANRLSNLTKSEPFKTFAGMTNLLKNIKSAETSAKGIGKYLDECSDVPTKAQIKSIQGRLERLKKKIIEISRSPIAKQREDLAPDYLLLFLSPVIMYIRQKIVAAQNRTDYLESMARQDAYSL